VYVLKQHYDPSWGKEWRTHFHTDAINGALGHELKFNGQPLIASYMRVREPFDSELLRHLPTDFVFVVEMAISFCSNRLASVPSMTKIFHLPRARMPRRRGRCFPSARFVR
jgi:hypothetical protein